MTQKQHEYVIVGAGLAGASAIEGIRELDNSGSILLVGAEPHLPYNRPPLSKGLWSGKKKIQDVFVHGQDFYDQHGVTTVTATRVVSLDADASVVTDSEGSEYRFEKLLIATGASPLTLPIPGGENEGVIYLRTLDDYLRLSWLAEAGRSVLVVGGGFIGTEIAAALATRKLDVTMIFPDSFPCSRVFPPGLGAHVLSMYRGRGVTVLTNDKPISFVRKGDKYLTQTREGRLVTSDLVVAGAGVLPSTELAQSAGLEQQSGILVDRYLETSRPSIFAAGDNACFPESLHGVHTRLEHWDNARAQGKHAGRNMAGSPEPYEYLSYFYSDLFDLGYEAVGTIDGKLETVSDWQKENEQGVVYYVDHEKIQGILLCNVWDKIDEARALLKNGASVHDHPLRVS